MCAFINYIKQSPSVGHMNINEFSCKERFLRYVTYDTQSSEESLTIPSTEKQKILGQLLLKELQELGINAQMDEHGYVYATIPSNTNAPVPPIGFIAHMDTSPAVSGKNVRPIIHENYQGADIILPKDNQRLCVSENPILQTLIGHDIITSDGSTLLGADDKAGIAAIMDAASLLMRHPEIVHGEIKIAFTVDEEVGRGIEKFDLKKFGATYAYTVDGDTVGDIEVETFNADKFKITITGHSTHTGYAKGKMINATRIAAAFIDALPKDRWSPETTEGREGFVHVNTISGSEEQAVMTMVTRDFVEEELRANELQIRELLDKTIAQYPGAKYTLKVIAQYRNMKKIIDQHPIVLANALEAVKRAGFTPNTKIVRGGTDGCALSYRGIPTPNMFCGEYNFHSKTEFVSVQDMQATVKTIIEICKVWAERSG